MDGAMDAAAGSGEGKSVRESWRRPAMTMRLHMVRGSFLPEADDDAAAAAGGVMDAEVWSKLPEVLIWEVVVRLPAAKHAQLQLVSRQWRRQLTSRHFRNTVVAAAAAARRDSAPTVVCMIANTGDTITTWSSYGASSPSSPVRAASASSNCKVVDIDLSFVPSWFWTHGMRSSRTYSVESAGHGLVCISNDADHAQLRKRQDLCLERWWDPSIWWTNRYCVLNPLTRTCVVLPRVPFQPDQWLPPSEDGLIIMYGGEGQIATYDLAGGGGGGGGARGNGWVVQSAAHMYDRVWDCGLYWERGSLARCGSHSYCFYDKHTDNDVPRVLTAPPAGSGPGLGAGKGGPPARLDVAALPVPSLALLGLDDVPLRYGGRLAAHRGFVYLVADLYLVRDEVLYGMSLRSRPYRAWGVWRLAMVRDGDGDGGDGDGEPGAWEGVAVLEGPHMERLTGLSSFDSSEGQRLLNVVNVYGAGDLLCCQVVWTSICTYSYSRIRPCFLLGFNLDMGEWKLLHQQDAIAKARDTNTGWKTPMPLELRPDVFLSGRRTSRHQATT